MRKRFGVIARMRRRTCSAREPDLDYVTLDYLAEVSMSILAMQRERDPAAGFARDVVEVVRSLASYWSRGGKCRLITNAGGLNPRGCAEACRAVLEETGCRSLRIGVVTGRRRSADAFALRPQILHHRCLPISIPVPRSVMSATG